MTRAPLPTLRRRRELAARIEGERRLVEVLRAMLALGATGTPTLSVHEIGRRLGHAVSDKHSRMALAARLRFARERGLVATSWDPALRATRYALTDAGVDHLREARRHFP